MNLLSCSYLYKTLFILFIIILASNLLNTFTSISYQIPLFFQLHNLFKEILTSALRVFVYNLFQEWFDITFIRNEKKLSKYYFFLTGLLTNILRTLVNITLLFIIKNTQIKKIMIKITSDACKNNYALSFWGHMCTLSLCYLFSGLETPRQANSLLFFSFLFLIL